MNKPPDVIAAPPGTDPSPLSSENVSVLDGMSESVAIAVNDNSASSSTTLLPMEVRTGGVLDGGGGAGVVAFDSFEAGPVLTELIADTL